MNKIIYLDAAASCLKSRHLVEIESDFLQNRYSNSGRGICERSVAVDKMIENARKKTADFIGTTAENIVFTSGTTDGLNRIVRILEASKAFSKDSQIVVSNLDHHSARLPWEAQAYLGNCKIKVCSLDSNFNINLNDIDDIDVFIITAMSNVLGNAQDVKNLVKAAKKINPKVITIVDGAQYVAYLPINVTDWDVDFLCFSGHKIGADTGIGVMYIKEPQRWAVDKLGGGMVSTVKEKIDKSGATSEWNLADGIKRFEGGTLPLTQIVGLPVAIDELTKHKDKQNLIKYLYSELSKIERIKIITKPDSHILSFVIDGMHCLDFGALIGAYGVCLRVGTMCASWIHNALGYSGTIRISVGSWNTVEDMENVVKIIKKILEK
ncbi:MAG: aminotransferase class V-fold PLP-dependent enzyme [Alphaproteobacteria bacterium]|nr:aminotransferase class V-fold PLP-dependent enzyme [Alphaproteobacteria bacterium]MBN2675556.1 aminotransferase class V-fold PLP-dependent enzyme [Alphaproteobacteria bacterium]